MPHRLLAFTAEYIDGNRDVADVRAEYGLTEEEVDTVGMMAAAAHEMLGIPLSDSMASLFLQGFETGYLWRDVYAKPPA